MRISEKQHTFTKQFWTKQNAEPYLFGSRVDDNKKGGDIDLLVLADHKITLNDKMQFLVSFFEKFGEQKIDIITYLKSDTDHFKQIALQGAIKL
jgi:predicted nucleotidyltransferase